ncbi:MAG TPA: hypothetical protein VGE41_04755 [Verrucomicrobiae bacterium]|jgi:hypothetical protein
MNYNAIRLGAIILLVVMVAFGVISRRGTKPAPPVKSEPTIVMDVPAAKLTPTNAPPQAK